jgi:hypothetical protein
VDWSDCFGFNNQYAHSSFNLSNEIRVIFLIDFDREFIGLEPGTVFNQKMVENSKPFIRKKNGYSILSAMPPNFYIKRIP